MNSDLPQYVSKTRFFELLDICFLTGQRLIERKVLQADAMLDGQTPLFIHNGESIASVHRAIAAYRKNLRLSRYNLTSAVDDE